MNVINRFTCSHGQLEKSILRLKSRRMPPIIDYIKESYHVDNAMEIKEKMYLYPNNHFALKLSALGIREKEEKCMAQVEKIIECALENECTVLIDAEEHAIQGHIDGITDHMMEAYNGMNPCVYKTYQMYKKDAPEKLRDDLCKARNYSLGVKLVRGAYLKKDKSMGVLCNNEEMTHAQYNQAIADFAYQHKKKDKLLCATHNVRSIHIARHYMKESKLCNVEFAQLMGMSDALSEYLQRSGYKVYKYLPYGRLYESVPYLTRRLYENIHMLKYINHF